jgi:hypothetical protein
MNFRQHQQPVAKKEPVLDMRDLARRLNQETDAVQSFAPPAIRNAHQEEVAINQIKSFGALPTKELDEIVAAAKAEIAHLEADAQAIRDMYMKHTKRVEADIKRLQEGVKLSMETMRLLREQCAKLDEPEVQPIVNVPLEALQAPKE